MKDNNEYKHYCYFADDGTYGDTGGLLIIDTSKWTDSDWKQIDYADDYDRQQVAVELSEKYVSDCKWVIVSKGKWELQ